jgi:DNA-binding response OmpR family regulator
VNIVSEYPGPIHLLLTDVVMPDFGGRTLAEVVRGQRPGLRVLYMSGYTDDAVVRSGVESSRDWFIQKPFTPLTLARRVREVLDSSADSSAS